MPVKHLYIFLLLTALLSSPSSYGNWETEASDRIELNRKRDVQITVVDSDGYPVPDVDVQIEQIKHRFAFGTCIDNYKLQIPNYTNFIKNHFEWGVCENASKWYYNEENQGEVDYDGADLIYNWCAENDIIMRGHCLFWEQTDWIRQWVKDLDYEPYPTPSDLLSAVDSRIDSAVNHFKGKFVHWDVDNEMLPTGSNYQFYDRLEIGGPGSTDVNSRVHMFQRANLIDPDCKLFLNEFTGNSFGYYYSGPYVSLANNMISKGAPVHGLGIQGHISPTFDPERYYDDVLDPLATVGLPIWVTEFDYSESDVNLRADGLEDFYRICFSHPSVEGIIMWGFWEDAAWRWDGIVNSDWTINAAGIRYENLMDEWTTTDSNTTDGSGNVTFRGFHGTYKITLSLPGLPSEIHTRELEPGETTAQFVLELDTSGPLAWDEFESGGWTGGGGWSSDWTHSGDACVTTSGDPYGGNYHLRLQTNTGVVTRTVNMTGATGAHLTFWYKPANFEHSDYATVQVYDGSWDTVLTIGPTTTSYSPADIDLSDYDMVSDFQVRFVAHMSSTYDQLYIDNVKVTGNEWLYGDLTHDNKVDGKDLYGFCEVWLVEDCGNTSILELDLDSDCTVNFYEYAFFAQNWLEEQ